MGTLFIVLLIGLCLVQQAGLVWCWFALRDREARLQRLRGEVKACDTRLSKLERWVTDRLPRGGAGLEVVR